MPKTRKASAKPKPGEKQTVLICAVGTTPAIITETVWALAQREEPIIPDRVVAITTATGRDGIVEQLFTEIHGQPPIWIQLKTKLLSKPEMPKKLVFGTEGDYIHVMTMPDKDGIPRALKDIRTVGENQTAADSILRVVDSYAKLKDTRVIGLMAGGRKTNSALMYACMSLVGKDDDMVCHVLVPPEYENRQLDPRLYFPKQKPETLSLPAYGDNKPKSLRAVDAEIEFIEVPFVPLRNAGVKIENSFMETVAAYSTAFREEEIKALQISLHIKTLQIEINGTQSKKIPGSQFLLMLYLAKLVNENKCGVRAGDEVVEELDSMTEEYHNQAHKDAGQVYLSLRTGLTRGGGLLKWDGSLSKHKNSLLAQLRKLGREGQLLADSMHGNGYWGMRGVTPKQIRVVDR